MFFLQLLLSLFLFLPPQTLLLSDLFGRSLFISIVFHKLIPHLLLSVRLFSLKFSISLFIPLSAIGIVSEACSGHGGGDVLDLLDGNGGDWYVSEFHFIIVWV